MCAKQLHRKIAKSKLPGTGTPKPGNPGKRPKPPASGRKGAKGADVFRRTAGIGESPTSLEGLQERLDLTMRAFSWDPKEIGNDGVERTGLEMQYVCAQRAEAIAAKALVIEGNSKRAKSFAITALQGYICCASPKDILYVKHSFGISSEVEQMAASNAAKTCIFLGENSRAKDIGGRYCLPPAVLKTHALDAVLMWIKEGDLQFAKKAMDSFELECSFGYELESQILGACNWDLDAATVVFEALGMKMVFPSGQE